MSRKRPKAELITIGAELLKGTVLNTNAKFLGARLRAMGFDMRAHVSCEDDLRDIKSRLRDALNHSDLIILSGGLGPTPDDVTREAIASYFKVPLQLSKQQYSQIEKYYKKRDQKVPKLVEKEAMYPKGATPLVNRHGIALGFSIKTKNKLVVALPGVPRELEKLFCERVQALAKKTFKNLKPKPSLIVKTIGISEPRVMESLGADFFDDPMDFGIYPSGGEVSLRIYTENLKIRQNLKNKVRNRLRDSVYALKECSFIDVVARQMIKRKKTIAVCESCTGGRLSTELTKLPGSSKYFLGSMTTYHNKVKQKLGVKKDALNKNGAVSSSVAKTMAKNIRKWMGSSYGIGITGIAGPGKDESKKPVGLVYIAIADSKSVDVYEHHFWGDRGQVQDRATKKALEYLWREIK